MRRFSGWLTLAALAVIPSGCRHAAPPPDRAANVSEQSVKPGINEPYEKIEGAGDVQQWVDRFEGESREIYRHRADITAAIGLRPGQAIADVGAGTGVFTELFSAAVGPSGTVYAEDIVPAFLKRIETMARERDLDNVKTVLGTEKSIALPPASVDVVFVCDTYHHFEYPLTTLATIHHALRPGGELIIVEFKRIEGESRDWVLGHVRAGKDMFTNEIQSAGFELIEEVDVDGLKENYILRFRRSP